MTNRVLEGGSTLRVLEGGSTVRILEGGAGGLTADILMVPLRQEYKLTKITKWIPSYENFTNWFSILPVAPSVTTEEIMGIYNQRPQSFVKRISHYLLPENYTTWFDILPQAPALTVAEIMTLYNNVVEFVGKTRKWITAPESFQNVSNFVVAFPIDVIMGIYNQTVQSFRKRITRFAIPEYPSWFYSIPFIPAITVEQIMAVFNNVKPFIAKSRLYTKIPESFTMGYQAVVFFPIDIAMGIYNQVVETWRKRTTWFNVPESYFAWINTLPQAPTLTTEMIMTLYNNVVGFVSKKRFQNWTPESYITWINSIPVFPIVQIMAIYNQVVPKFVKRVVKFNVPESYNVWKNVILVTVSLVIKTFNLYISRKQHDLVVPKKSHNLFIPLKLHTAVISGKLHKVLISIKNHMFLS